MLLQDCKRAAEIHPCETFASGPFLPPKITVHCPSPARIARDFQKPTANANSNSAGQMIKFAGERKGLAAAAGFCETFLNKATTTYIYTYVWYVYICTLTHSPVCTSSCETFWKTILTQNF